MLPIVVAAGLVSACGETTPGGGSDASSTGPASTTVIAPTTEPTTTAPRSTEASTTTGAPTTTTEPGVAPGETVVPIESVPVIDGVLSETAFEASGIGHRCVREPAFGQPKCTQVVHDPWGVPISWDPATRTLTRHAEDGTEARAVLDESFTTSSVVAAGPDEVVYLNVVTEPGAEGSADLVAMTLAPGDAGRVLERADGVGNPGADFDLVAVPAGVTTTDWYGQGPRPNPARQLLMPWVDRDSGDSDVPASGVDASPNGVDDITINAYDGTVTVNGRTWQLTGDAASIAPTGMPLILRTFDGGFVARYDEFFDDYRSIVVRGWPDGSVTEWVVPSEPNSIGGVRTIPEPMGSVLVASGDRFVRLYPSGIAPAAWDLQSDVDVEAGRVDTTPLNNHLNTLDWSVDQPPWDVDAVASAHAAAGPLFSPAELRTITIVERRADATKVVVTDSGFLDDSVFATQLTMTIASDLRRVDQIEWANRCQPERGHQTFENERCR